MPFVVPAVAAAVTWVGGAAAALTGMLAAPMVGLLGEGGAILLAGGVLKTGALMGASALASALLQPKTGAGGSPTAFKADPAAPIGGVMGRFGTAGRQIHMRSWGKENLFLSFATVLSLGPIQSVEAFSANGNFVTFPGPQGMAANIEPYKDKMWMTYKLGLPTDGTLGPPTGQPQGTPAMDPPWTAAHRTSGYALSFWTMRNNSKRASYESGVPRPLWYLLGQKVWDPRYDSTYPGGLGPQRRDDWRTWAWNENPYLHALAWVRGHHKLLAGGSIDRSKRLAGVGAPDEAIDIGAFIQGANLCDVNVWPIGGEWTTVDDKWQTLASMLQAGGGVPLNRGAQISCMANAPRASLYTLTSADIVGPVRMGVMAARRDRFNTIIPRYRDETYKFEQVAAGEVTSSVYRDEDRGEPRTREVAYNFVTRAKQAAELAAYDIANARETLTASIPCKPHLLGLRAGDALTVEAPELGLNGQKFIVLKRTFDPGTTVVTLELRSETDGKHPWALGQAADPPTTPGLTSTGSKPDAPEGWVVTPRPGENGGVSQPGVIVVGTAPDNVGRMLVEYVLAPLGEDGEPLPRDEVEFDTLEWAQAYDGPATTSRVQISGLRSNEWYWVGVTYFSLKGVPSERTHYGPTRASELAADIAPDAPALEDIRAEARAKAALLIKEAVDRWNRDEKEKTFTIQNVEYVSEKLAITRETLELADADQLALLEVERVARIDADEAESTARQLQIAGVEESVAAIDDFSRATATALGNETETRTTQVSSLGNALAIVDGRATTAVNTANSAAEATTALASEVEGVESTAVLALSTAADAKDQIGDASFAVEVASGGDPAMIYARAKGATSVAGMVASVLRFGTLVGGTAVEAMRLFAGEVFFMRPIYIDVGAKRLIVGPGGDWVMWFGPNTINAAAATRINGHWAFGSDGKVYYGTSELGTGGGLGAVAVPDIASGSAPGGGTVSTSTVEIVVSGPGASSATVRWVKTDEVGGNVDVFQTGRLASFTGSVSPGGLTRAIYLAIVSFGGQTATVVVDVQLTDSN